MHTETPKRDATISTMEGLQDIEAWIAERQEEAENKGLSINPDLFDNALATLEALRVGLPDETMITEAA